MKVPAAAALLVLSAAALAPRPAGADDGAGGRAGPYASGTLTFGALQAPVEVQASEDPQAGRVTRACRPGVSAGLATSPAAPVQVGAGLLGAFTLVPGMTGYALGGEAFVRLRPPGGDAALDLRLAVARPLHRRGEPDLLFVPSLTVGDGHTGFVVELLQARWPAADGSGAARAGRPDRGVLVGVRFDGRSALGVAGVQAAAALLLGLASAPLVTF